MPDTNELVPKTENSLATGIKMPAGLNGVGAGDFLRPRYKIWHPMAKTEVVNAKLGLFYEANGAALAGDTLRFYLLSQKNTSFTGNDGKVKNYKHLLVVIDGRLDIPAEISLSGSGIRPVQGLNTGLLQKSLEDKSPTTFGYLVEAKIEVKENDNGKFGVPKFTIVGTADAETFEKLAKLHSECAEAFTSAGGVDTATAYSEDESPLG